MSTNNKQQQNSNPSAGSAKLPVMRRYTCINCGNTCLAEHRPDNIVCGGCKKPDWKLLKYQQSYIVGQPDWICTEGEV